MKVLHVCKASGIGGAERHLLSLLPALSRAGVDTRICVAGTGSYQRFVGPLRDLGIGVTVLPAGPDINPMLYARLVSQARKYRPDVVHTHLIHADLHGQLAARTLRLPTVSSVHGTHDFYRHMPYRAAATLAGHLSSRTIAISKYVAQFLGELRLAAPGDIRIVRYGLDAAGWQLSTKERLAARRTLGLEDHQIAVGVASRLVAEKGHAFLIEAVQQAIHATPNLCLLIAGAGPLRAELEDLARSLPTRSVRFLGFLPRVREFMNACDIFAFPTLPLFGEGFGLAALEAMAAARPIVASKVGPLPEVVSEGTTGLLVSPGAVDELARALTRLATDADLRRDFGAQGRKRVEHAFSLMQMVDETVRVYEELCSFRESRLAAQGP